MAAGDPGVLKRNFSATAIETTLVSSISSAATNDVTTSVAVVSTSGYPSVPFTLILGPDTNKEEVVTVTAVVGVNLTIVRGQDNTPAVAHTAGTSVRHGVSGRDFKEEQTHIAARGYDADSGILSNAQQTHVHGLVAGDGSVVGADQSVTLTRKTLTTPTINGATLTGAVTSTAAIDMTGGTITGLSSAGMVASSAAPKNYVDSILGSATSASISAASAAVSATSAATSASSALTSQTAAATSATSAATSASSALTSQTAAATSATSAAASATAAATSATSAAASATTASNSAATASTQAGNAAASATAAATSATSAAASATAAASSAGTAATSASQAATSATSAALSASSAATSVTSAGISATNASTSAASASTSASSALTSQTAAATSATSAAASATAAATSATSAAASATSAASSYDSFDDRYLGAKSTAPTVDNDGNALLTGALYWNTSVNKMYVWSGTAWGEISSSAEIIAYKYTVAAGATSVSGADDNSLTLSYTVGKEQVYINGVLQVRGTDYVATTGSSITGMAAMIASDIVTVLAFTAFSVSNTYTQAEADAKFVQNTGNFSAGKNKIINGDMNIWQRGASITAGTGTVYNTDRFYSGRDGSAATVTVSRQQFTAGTAPVTGYENLYFLRFNQSVAGSGGSYSVVGQRIEGATTLANQTATVSFWAKADTSRTITLNFNRGYGTGGSGDDYNIITAPSFNVTTSWQRFTASFTIPSVAGKTIASNGYLEMNFFLSPNTVQTVDFWGVQLEAGSVATAFQTATGTIQGELAACQRYYVRFTCEPGAPFAVFAPAGLVNLTTSAICWTHLPVELRVYPISIEYGGSLLIETSGGASVAVTNVLSQDRTNKKIVSNTYQVSSGLTTGNFAAVRANNSSTAYLGISAEL